jgi:hypothetical protein
MNVDEEGHKMYLAGAVDIQYGALQDIEVAIAKQEGREFHVSRSVEPEQIAEVVSRTEDDASDFTVMDLGILCVFQSWAAPALCSSNSPATPRLDIR